MPHCHWQCLRIGINHYYINMSQFCVPLYLQVRLQNHEISFYGTSDHITFGLRDSFVVPHTIIIHPGQEFDGENIED